MIEAKEELTILAKYPPLTVLCICWSDRLTAKPDSVKVRCLQLVVCGRVLGSWIRVVGWCAVSWCVVDCMQYVDVYVSSVIG